jgi:hypothetical protein
MNRLGKWSASILAIGGIAYAIVVVIGMVSYGLERSIGGIVLVVMEMLTLLLALVFLVMMAAIHSSAALEWKTNTLVALVFAALLAGISATVHFVQLTALRQLGTAGLVWPSPMYAAELLAWDVFLGLSLLFAAPSLRGNRLRQVARTTMTACGAMCLIGVLGPATGYMGLQFLAVAGYGLVLPVLCVLLALNWSRTGGA